MSAARILVVDDDARHAQSVRALLLAHGYDVVCETDPRRGLDTVRASPFDVLVLDLNMPGLSGVAFLSALGEGTTRTKTIVLSGETRLNDITPILRLGAYDYLPKPYEPQELVTSVRNAAGRVALERENVRIQQDKEVANRRHEFLVNASPDLIYMLDSRGNFSFLNSQLQEVFEYDSRTLDGAHWTRLFESGAQAVLHRRIDERRSGARATRHLEIDYPDRSGRARVLELSAMGLYESAEPRTEAFIGTYGIIRDVTEPRRTARALAQSQQKFYGLFFNSPDPVFISRLDDGRMLEHNESFGRLFAPMADVTQDLVVWGSPTERLGFVAQLTDSPGRHQAALERPFPEGKKYLEVTGRIIEQDGIPCIIASVRDRTAQKQAELDRLSLEAQLQRASKMEAIGQLAGGIAHDFNNILASIIGYTELALVTSTAGADTGTYLKEVVVAGQRARDLISQMLTFTRAHRGNAQITAVGERIAEMSRILRAAIPRTIDVATSLHTANPRVVIDPVQLQQIVINLLINARDAIDGVGRIDVRVNVVEAAGRCASCDAEFGGEHVVLSVADTGHGIAADVLPRIFDMFVTTREPGRGTGIGLWLIHTIVHEYEGHVGVVTGPAGTTFNVYLPLAERAGELLENGDAGGAAAGAIDGRVLVVDDEVSMSNFIGEVLRDAGYDAVVLNDGAAALDYIESHVHEIALILTDHSLSHLTGFDIADAVRRLRHDLPVVVLTGYADRADGERLERAVARVLPKPFKIDALLALVRELTEAETSTAQ